MRRIEVGDVALRLFRFVLLAFFLLSPLSSFAQDGEEPAETDVEIETAPVTVDGETYFIVRGSVSFTAERRAEKIVERIIEAAEARPRGDPKVETKDSEFGLWLAGMIFLVAITRVIGNFSGIYGMEWVGRKVIADLQPYPEYF